MFRGLTFFMRQGWKYDKKYILWLVFYQLINSLIPILATIMPKYIIDELMGARDLRRLSLYVGLLAGYTLLATCLSNFFKWDGFTRRCKVNAEFDNALHGCLAACDYERLEDPKYLDRKEKAKKFMYCDYHGFGYLLDCAINIIGQLITLVVIAAIVARLDWRVALLFFTFVLVNTKIENSERKKAMSMAQEMIRDQRGWIYYSDLFEDAQCGKEIRMNSMGRWLLDRERSCFERINENIGRQNKHYTKSGNYAAIFTFLQQGIGYAYLIYSVIRSSISIGDFAMYTGAITAFATALRTVISSLTEIQAYDMYYEDLDEYLNVPLTLRSGAEKDISTGEIEFHNVSFRYPGSETFALHNVNMKIRLGEKLAVVGENGAGKTTFVKLLTRLYDPTEGTITLNGQDIRKIDYDAYQALFSTVYQDYKLFSFSLKDNVSLALPSDADQIRSVLHHVGLEPLLAKLPDGIETSLYKNFDESGFEPSGGEGQKIALARALYKNAPYVILDEPTAALDPKSEYELYRKFDDMVSGKTAVFISHRMASTRFCDTIAVFSGGKIVESGTHDALMKKEGVYHAMFTIQTQYYV